MLDNLRIGLIGAGVMAEMLAEGLIRSRLVEPQSLIASHNRQDRLNELTNQIPIRTTVSNVQAYRDSDVAILCVRPQAMAHVLSELGAVMDPHKLLVSIAAGVPMSAYAQRLPRPVPFVRAMPTFFGRIKKGTTGLALNELATAEHLAIASRIFGTVSENVIVLPESEIDAFTTFGSTTTATVYLLLDALITAGSLIGLRHQASHSSATEQVMSAARYVAASEKLPSQLQDELCTPGGVTVESVKVLEARAVRGAVIDGVLAATQRARELRSGVE